jgi:hypothetical protein
LLLEPSVPALRTYLTKVKSQTGADIRRELFCSSSSRSQILDELFLKSSLNNFLPPIFAEGSFDEDEEEAKWTTSNELDTYKEGYELVMEQNVALMRKLTKTQQYADSAATEAKNWRDQHDLLMSNRKKHIIREDSAGRPPQVSHFLRDYCDGLLIRE